MLLNGCYWGKHLALATDLRSKELNRNYNWQGKNISTVSIFVMGQQWSSTCMSECVLHTTFGIPYLGWNKTRAYITKYRHSSTVPTAHHTHVKTLIAYTQNTGSKPDCMLCIAWLLRVLSGWTLWPSPTSSRGFTLDAAEATQNMRA